MAAMRHAAKRKSEQAAKSGFAIWIATYAAVIVLFGAFYAASGNAGGHKQPAPTIGGAVSPVQAPVRPASPEAP